MLGIVAPAFATCGDSLLDTGEHCDDGNTNDADGCSALCLLETGFECTAPIAPDFGTNVVQESGFELGTPSIAWSEMSTNFTTPICDPVSCALTGAFEGDWWAWFGGSSNPELASLTQTLSIPATATELRLRLWQRLCDSNDDYLSILIDGAELLRIQPCVVEAEYRLHTIDISSFADDSAHIVQLEAQSFATNGGATNLFVDDVRIHDNLNGAPAQPSVCTALPSTCHSEDFGAVGAGSLSNWTVFNTGTVTLDWGTTDDGLCGSGALGAGTPAPNVTGGDGEAACIDTDANGFGAVEAWACTPALNYSLSLSPQLRFKYNYQLFGASDPDDLFEVLVGTASPDPSSVLAYTSLFATSENAGTLLGTPGAQQTIALNTAQTAHICFRYRGNFDHYAQLDDVQIVAPVCDLSADPDADGLISSQDNCTEIANADQRDTDADGIGNACDADLDNDCVVNFLDLALMKLNFFASGDLDSDLDGDGVTNFNDLALLKARFFLSPGPSGLTNCEQ